MTDTVTPPKSAGAAAAPRWPGRLAVVAAFLWTFAVTYGAQMTAWSGAVFGTPDPNLPPLDVRASLLQAILLALPLLLGVRLVRAPRYRAVFAAWLQATLVMVALALPRLLPSTATQALMLLQIVALLMVAWLLRRRYAFAAAVTELDATPWALGAAALFALPWAVYGVFGAVFDTTVALLLALVFGLVMGRLLAVTWLEACRVDSHGPRRDLGTGGLVMGMALVIAASGLSHNGLQLALMVSLAAWGWVMAGLATVRQPGATPRNWLAVALFVALAVFVLLTMVDTDGMLLEVMDRLLAQTWTAVGVSVLAGWLLGVIAWLAARRLPAWRPTRGLGVTVGVLWLAVYGLHLSAGVPGAHGDRLFVVMNEQADVHALAAIDEPVVRRTAVYTELTSHAADSQAGLTRALARLGYAYTPYYLVNAVEVQGGLPTRLWLSLRRDVDRVLPSPQLRPTRGPLTVAAGVAPAPDAAQWNLTDIGAARVWTELGVTGAGVVVGQSDSGAQADHPELADSYRGRDGQQDYNWFDPWQHTPAPVDFGGHGTHTLGSVLGNTVGVAPDAQWIACANLTRNLGNAALYLDCWQFMLAPFPQDGDPMADGDPAQGAQVLNNSWGCPQNEEGCDPESLQSAAAALRTAGVFTVVSAGNSGPRCHTVDAAPAIYADVLTVGAVDQNGNLAPFSSTGPVTVDGSGRTKPDLLAPGVDVLSAYPGGTYELASGTSMAGPHVAGVVALMWSANPALVGDIARTEQILLETARPSPAGWRPTSFRRR
ncbi:MAG: S8 family serine peptidase [Caldilineaceae bacterium]